MTYRPEGLGTVAAVDAALTDMGRTRFMSPNKGARWVAGYFRIVTATVIKIRPVYIPQVDEGSGQSWADNPRYEDVGQEVTYTAAGDYTTEFKARPGFRVGFRLHTLTGGGTVEMMGQYLDTLGT